MTLIKITNGIYGYKSVQGNIEPKHRGELVSVKEDEAQRLLNLGVAEIIQNQKTVYNGSYSKSLNEDDLLQKTIKELKIMAEELGLDTSRLKSKGELISSILSVKTDCIKNTDSDMPNISAEMPI